MAAKKVLIDDICDVYNNHWPSKDWYMEDSGEVYSEELHGVFKYSKDGKLVPKEPGQMVSLSDFDFYFAWQGKGEPEKEIGSFAAHFRRIQKAKTTIKLLVEVPKDQEHKFRGIVSDIKGLKIL